MPACRRPRIIETIGELLNLVLEKTQQNNGGKKSTVEIFRSPTGMISIKECSVKNNGVRLVNNTPIGEGVFNEIKTKKYIAVKKGANPSSGEIFAFTKKGKRACATREVA